MLVDTFSGDANEGMKGMNSFLSPRRNSSKSVIGDIFWEQVRMTQLGSKAGQG